MSPPLGKATAGILWQRSRRQHRIRNWTCAQSNTSGEGAQSSAVSGKCQATFQCSLAPATDKNQRAL
jgi:hypothetical protein